MITYAKPATWLFFVLLSCKDQENTLEIQDTQSSRQLEKPTNEKADAASSPVGELIYSQRTLTALLGVAIDPLVATPGFSNFRTDPELPRGLVLESTSGSITGAAIQATESTLYRISADRLGRTETTELAITVYARPVTPQPPIPPVTFTSSGEIKFPWRSFSTSSLGARIVAYHVQLAKFSADLAEPEIIETQKTTDNEWTFTVTEEGNYAAKIQSIDTMGQASSFSEFSSQVTVDRTPPVAAAITRVLAQPSAASLSAMVEWTAGADGNGSAPENLTYSVCYEGSSNVLAISNTCEPTAGSQPLPSVTGATSLKLPPIQLLAAQSSEMRFRVITQDQAGHKTISAAFMFFLQFSTGPSSDN